MGGIFSHTYLTDEQTALNWWRSLGDEFLIFRIRKGKQLSEAGDFENYDAKAGICWKVSSKQASQAVILVCSWLPKMYSEVWRIDIDWGKDGQICVNAVQKVLVDAGAKLKNNTDKDQK